MLPPSENLLHFVENIEGYRSEAYQLVGEKYFTIGFGTSGPQVHSGMTCTLEQATQWLQEGINSAYNSVCHLVIVPLSKQGQVDALTDFVYNLGAGAFASSTLLELLNHGNYSEVPAQLKRFVYGGNKEVMPGLIKRRNAEIAMWNAS
jgi:lysozyme